MQKRILKLVTLGFLATALSGCGLEALLAGLEDGGVTEKLSEKHASKTKMTGRMAGLMIDGATSKNKLTQADMQVTANDKGGYDIVLEGETFSFTSAGYSQAKRSFTKTVNVAGGQKSMTLTLASSQPGCCDYADVVTFISQNSASKDGLQINGIYGVKTEKMPTTATATYNGEFLFSGMNKNTRAALSELGTGKINMTADFASNKVSGNISELKTAAFSNVNAGTKTIGGMSIDNGSISAGGFKADLTGDAAMNNYYGQTTNGKLVGDFYGPNALEAGGVMTVENATKIGYGAFVAKQ